MVNIMDKFLIDTEHYETTLKLLELINRTTDDYLYFMDIKKGLNWFFGPVDINYNLRTSGGVTVTDEEVFAIVHPADRKALKEDLDRGKAGLQDTHDMNYRWINREGAIVWVNCRGHVIYGQDGTPAVMIGRVSEEALRHLYNPLTGLRNKRKLREDLKNAMQTGKQTMILLDIDGLASINLAHGRSYGDALLKEIAAYLDAHRLVWRAYHIDHNNFAVIPTDAQDKTAEIVFSELCEAYLEKCTFTAAAVPVDHELFIDIDELMDSANVTLKEAKQKARNQLEFFSPDEIERRIEARTLLEKLRESVQNDFAGFELYYQPQVKGGSYDLYGVEALLRYNSGITGRVFPDKFIPILEQSHLIEQVGLWVLETALVQCKQWRTQIPDLHISVNFSSVQFEDPDIGYKIVEVLKKVDIPGDALTVELTESVQIQENMHIPKAIKYLKSCGVHFSVDDFGTGYSSLGYLKALDISEVKIDRSFVSNIRKDGYNFNLVSNIIAFAKQNDIRICCEGVETAEELAVIDLLKPDTLQGYLFGKPCAAREIEQSHLHIVSDPRKDN